MLKLKSAYFCPFFLMFEHLFCTVMHKYLRELNQPDVLSKDSMAVLQSKFQNLKQRSIKMLMSEGQTTSPHRLNSAKMY